MLGTMNIERAIHIIQDRKLVLTDIVYLLLIQFPSRQTNCNIYILNGLEKNATCFGKRDIFHLYKRAFVKLDT